MNQPTNPMTPTAQALAVILKAAGVHDHNNSPWIGNELTQAHAHLTRVLAAADALDKKGQQLRDAINYRFASYVDGDPARMKFADEKFWQACDEHEAALTAYQEASRGK